MAVYTEVSEHEARELLHSLGLGELSSLKACSGGIENTNYFASTERAGQVHDYVLTLFERLSFEQLPFYLRLMKHLAQRGILVPEPHANAQGELVFDVKGKPAAVVDKLHGKSELAPTEAHCAQVGATLARLHLAGSDFALTQPNLRGLAWWNEVVPVVLPYIQGNQQNLLQSELAYQNSVAASASYAALPRGPIHADLFRDNVMFDTVGGQPQLSGFFDFYFAGIDTWVFDLAVCLNDWCVDLPTGVHHAPRAQALIAAYSAVRPLQAAERELLPAMLRAGALRFWVSRLWDFYLPRAASLLQAHDPSHFERVLQARCNHNMTFEQLAGQA
ncbi:homoserine kinase [Rhodoferax sp. U11-2br]|uniref:homoserine kinase n=1 Tax=Rhodoferax sp. U11-2br TaxID=2838878 RepID=UPI001BEAF4E3|nr:homoserine kinase [Rhodoferax sp. U11-2br]MBT3068884.1 homoserine kinase [Rhodoferax sp. U11-2br]